MSAEQTVCKKLCMEFSLHGASTQTQALFSASRPQEYATATFIAQ